VQGLLHVLCKRVKQVVIDRKDPHTLFGLWRLDFAPPKRLADADLAVLEIHLVPLQSEDLANPGSQQRGGADKSLITGKGTGNNPPNLIGSPSHFIGLWEIRLVILANWRTLDEIIIGGEVEVEKRQ
jgi:hypothetical protein